MSLPSPKSRPAYQVFFLAVVLAASGFSFTARSQETIRREIVFPVPIQWDKQKGVTRYRLQIAADEKFQDVFFDGRVTGSRYVASNLSAGYYFWRIAPADSQPGGFSRPMKFFVSGGVVKTVKPRSRGAR